MNEKDERVDQAIKRFIQAGEISEELQPHREALRALKGLEQVPGLDAERAHLMRQQYLDQVDSIKPAVSPSQNRRLNGWSSIFRKERSPMFAMARIITIAAILLGGTAGTAFAAQGSLPDQALYPVKTLIEDIRLDLTSDPQAEFDLLMRFIEQRFAEIQTMVENGEPVGEVVQLRLQNQLQAAFRNAAELEEPAFLQAMEKIRARSQVQENIFNQVQNGAGAESNGNIELAQEAIIRSRIQAEGALEDPNTLRTRYGAERNEDAPVQPEVIPPGEGQGGPPDGAGEGEAMGPSDPGNGNFGTPGPRRNGQTK